MTINIGAHFRVHKLGLCIIVIILIVLYLYSVRQSSYSQINNREVSLKNLLASAIKAAEIGGIEVVRVHDNPKYAIESKGKTKEGVNDPVTLADYQSHCAMYQFLSSVFSNVDIISEEQAPSCDPMETPDLNGANRNIENYNSVKDLIVQASDVTVWIDPLDATKEFTENLLDYVTTMVCIAVEGIPIIGVIHKPFAPKQTYWAWVDYGVSRNLKNIFSPIEKTPVLIVSRSHAGRVHNASKTAFGDNVKIVSAAGAGFKSLEVASGNATAYIHMTNIKKWDVCAGAAIISALGGTVTSLSGEPMTDFSPGKSKVLEHGLLATMADHKWYLDKFHYL
ncbi:putative inositol monophosphatase 3 [Venturia canescens]|uniref:putative inositol monophosphatase 3 n=1 Tax=Venturia canescens TaxID=32260 RepID=UPI001C9C7729|nr:putative inositol monophosphatase 3 [Venturia canescens]